MNYTIKNIFNTNSADNNRAFSFKTAILLLFLCIIFFLAPLIPDIKLSRPKLLLLETGIYGLFFLWLSANFYNLKFNLKKSIVLLPLTVYFLYVLIFYLFSPDKPVALNELKRCILSVTAFIVVSNILKNNLYRKIFLVSVVFGSFLSFLYGLLQHSGGLWIIQVPKFDRVISTFGNPIFFAAYIVIILPVIFYFVLSGRFFNKLLFSLIFLSGLFALYYTKTRASYIGFFVSFTFLLFLIIKNRKLLYFSIVLFAFSALCFVSFNKNILLRQQEHLLIWRDSYAIFQKFPVFGTGPGTFHIYFPQFASDQLKSIWPQDKFIVNDAHNEYVQVLTETGIIGFGIFAWLFFTLLFNSFKTINKLNGRDRLLAVCLTASGTAILTQNIFSVDMRFIISSVYFFTVMAVIDSFNEESFIFHIKIPRFVLLSLAAVCAFFTFQAVFKPYIAQKIVSVTPDFFDEKILDPLKTVDDLKIIAAKYPDKSSIYEKLGWVYAKEKNFSESINSYTKAVSLNPSSFGSYNNMGNIYFLLGNRNKAIELWNKSLEIKPDQIDSRLNLAVAYYYAGQLKLASDNIIKVLELDPKNEKAIVMLKQMTE